MSDIPASYPSTRAGAAEFFLESGNSLVQDRNRLRKKVKKLKKINKRWKIACRILAGALAIALAIIYFTLFRGH